MARRKGKALANIKSHGSYKIGTHKVTTRDEGADYVTVYSYTLCSDGRVLVKHRLKYDDRRYSTTGNYKVWGRINNEANRNMAFLVKALKARGKVAA